jgi:ketosteroid isomerase-like protein
MLKPIQLLALIASLTAVSCNRSSKMTQDELVRRTQELMAAVAPGDQAPWKKHFAEDAMYFDEKGRAMDKKALITDLSPMPAGYSGSIKVTNPRSNIDGDTAILSYDMLETETIFGQELHARYHETDTWRRRNGEWKIVAGQVLRYYEDPVAGAPDLRKFAGYTGTYQLAPGTERTVTIADEKLYTQRGERPKEQLLAEASDVFFRTGVEGRILFHYGKDGKVEALVDRRNNEDVVWKKIK